MGYIAGAVYILADEYNDKIYIGVTSQLYERVLQHRSNSRNGNANWNRIFKLVHVEYFEHIGDAIRREKQLKHSLRQYKNLLIEQSNPGWHDLFDTLDGTAFTYPYQNEQENNYAHGLPRAQGRQQQSCPWTTSRPSRRELSTGMTNSPNARTCALVRTSSSLWRPEAAAEDSPWGWLLLSMG